MVDGTLHDREDYVEAGRIVNEETERMRRLVEDLLELSTMESGQTALDLTEVDLATLLRQVVDRVDRAAADQGIELVYHQRAVPTVRADARRMERVLDNLLGNAIKHTPPGGVITVVLDRATDGGQHARVAVHNSGSLIPREDLPRIFERFYQVDKSRTGSAVGSGLGLAIAREIVQAHGGRISAVSSPASGTEFTVTIPCLDPVATAGIASTPGVRREPVVGRARAS
jgi:signal transduction histidine kinase